MATTAAARVTGICLKSSERSGSKVQPDGSSRNWIMRQARILVGGEDVTDVSFGDNEVRYMPGKGEAVDLLVSIRQSGTFLNIDAVGPWTDAHEDASTV